MQLLSLYSNDPREKIIAQGATITPDEDAAFWSGLHSAGLVRLDPKVLSLEDKDGATQLVLHVAGQMKDGRRWVVSMAQIWVNAGGGSQIVMEQRSGLAADSGRSLPEPVKTNPNLYPSPAEAQQELTQAKQRAALQHKRVLVVFGANWCYDCHVLDATLRAPNFAPLVNANYIVVHINTGDDGKANNDLADSMGVVLSKGIPAVAVLDASGNVIEAQKNGEFESTTRIGPADVRSFLEKYKPH